jgi:hypothetical protein
MSFISAPDEVSSLQTSQIEGGMEAHQQNGGAREVAEDVVPDALGDGRQVGVVAARVGVVVADDGDVLGREVVLDEGERELKRGKQRQVLWVVGKRDGVDEGDDGRGRRGVGEATDEEAVDGRRRVLQRVQRELDVRRLGHLVPALHAHLRSALPPPLSRVPIGGFLAGEI